MFFISSSFFRFSFYLFFFCFWFSFSIFPFLQSLQFSFSAFLSLSFFLSFLSFFLFFLSFFLSFCIHSFFFFSLLISISYLFLFSLFLLSLNLSVFPPFFSILSEVLAFSILLLPTIYFHHASFFINGKPSWKMHILMLKEKISKHWTQN